MHIVETRKVLPIGDNILADVAGACDAPGGAGALIHNEFHPKQTQAPPGY